MDSEEGPMAVPFLPLPPPPEVDSRVPAQVDVAFEVVRWGNAIEAPHSNAIEARNLNPKERSVYEAGLEVLRLYLTGEMTFAEPRKPVEDHESVEAVKVDFVPQHRRPNLSGEEPYK